MVCVFYDGDFRLLVAVIVSISLQSRFQAGQTPTSSFVFSKPGLLELDAYQLLCFFYYYLEPVKVTVSVCWGSEDAAAQAVASVRTGVSTVTRTRCGDIKGAAQPSNEDVPTSVVNKEDQD